MYLDLVYFVKWNDAKQPPIACIGLSKCGIKIVTVHNLGAPEKGDKHQITQAIMTFYS